MICKNFLPSGGLSLHFPDGVLWSVILKILTTSCLSVCFFWCLWFWRHFYFFIFFLCSQTYCPVSFLFYSSFGNSMSDHSSCLSALSSLRAGPSQCSLQFPHPYLLNLPVHFPISLLIDWGSLKEGLIFLFCWVSQAWERVVLNSIERKKGEKK